MRRGLLTPGITTGSLLGTLLLLIFVIYPLVEPSGPSGIVIALGLILVMTSGCLAVIDHRRLRGISVLLATLSIVGQILRLLSPSRGAVSFALVSAIAMLLFTTVVILRNVLTSPRVTSRQIQGAVSAYLLIGLAFGLLYALIEHHMADAFRFGPATAPFDDRVAGLVYFSFVTITTLGYGDITPLVRVARSLSTLEAVFGQFYLAVLIARLVSLEVAHRGGD